MIMYILLTGRHPLYKNGEGIEAYTVKLKNPIWDFSKGFSKLAKDLFLKLMEINPTKRYTANEALHHPWITRVPNDIPISRSDIFKYENAKVKLKEVLCFKV